MLETMSLYDDLRRLLVDLEWENFVKLQEPMYEWFVWEFMSSLVIDLRRKFDEVQGTFVFVYLTQRMKCISFALMNCCIYLLLVH